MDTTTTLLWVVVAAFLAPIVVDFLPIPKVPVVVVELVLGIIFGPHLINLIADPVSLHALQEFGVISLFFLAGFEVDMAGIRGGPLRVATRTWLLSMAIALAIAFSMQQADLISEFHLVAIAFATTALGPLMPMLADRRLIGTTFGNHTISIGTIGEFGPVLLVAFLLNQSRSAVTTAALILTFGVVCVALLQYVNKLVKNGRQNRLVRIALTSFHSTSQFAVRFSLLVLVLLVYVAQRFELDVLLGAFAAGFIIGQMGEFATTAGADRAMDRLQGKLESIGYGLFIPIFFVLTGANLNLPALFESNRALVALPLLVVGSFIIRGLPTILLYRQVKPAMRVRLSLMSATQLPLVATLMATYISREYVPEDLGTAIIIGCVITVAIFPLLGFSGLKPDDGEDENMLVEKPDDEEAISEKSIPSPVT